MTNIEALAELKRLRASSTDGFVRLDAELAARLSALASVWPMHVISLAKAEVLTERAERGIAILTANKLTR